MNRENKLKILQAIASGDLSTIGRRLPTVYVTKFKGNQKALQEDVRTKYGPTAQLIMAKNTAIVISIHPGFWIFYEEEDGTYMGGGGIYTKEEYEKLLKELDGENIEWVEVRPRVLTFIRQEGNMPIVDIDSENLEGCPESGPPEPEYEQPPLPPEENDNFKPVAL